MKKILVFFVIIVVLASCLSTRGELTTGEIPEPSKHIIGIVIPENNGFQREMAGKAGERLAVDYGGTFISRDWTLNKGDTFTIELIESPEDDFQLFYEIVERCSIVITIESAFNSLVQTYHANRPETHFLAVNGWVSNLSEDDNVTLIRGSSRERGFCAGVAAGLSGAENLGCIDPEYNKQQRAGFMAGAMYADLRFTDLNLFDMRAVDTWYDTDRAYNQATEMYQNGVGIIFANAGSSNNIGIYKAAMENGKHVIGSYASDHEYLDEDVNGGQRREQMGELLTALLEDRFDNMIYIGVSKILETGHIPGGWLWLGFEDDPFRLLPNPFNIADIEEAGRIVGEAAEKIISGDLELPWEPVIMGDYIAQVERLMEETSARTVLQGEESPGSVVDEPLPVVSVMDLTLEKISTSEGLLIVDLLSSSLIRTGDFTVIDRAQRKTILEEIAFSLEGCTDESCQLEAGRLLAADKIIVGSTGALGSKYILNLKLVDVETSASVTTAYEIFDSLDDMVEGIDSIVMELSK